MTDRRRGLYSWIIRRPFDRGTDRFTAALNEALDRLAADEGDVCVANFQVDYRTDDAMGLHAVVVLHWERRI